MKLKRGLFFKVLILTIAIGMVMGNTAPFLSISYAEETEADKTEAAETEAHEEESESGSEVIEGSILEDVLGQTSGEDKESDTEEIEEVAPENQDETVSDEPEDTEDVTPVEEQGDESVKEQTKEKDPEELTAQPKKSEATKSLKAVAPQKASGNRDGEDDWLHYSIDLIWDIADDDQKINQTVDSTSNSDVLQPKYKFTIQTSTVDYAPEAMEFTLPLSLFPYRNDCKDKNGDVLKPDPAKFYPDVISITDDPDTAHSNSFYYTADYENDKLIIKNRDTIYAGTNATIQVRYDLHPGSIYDMAIGKLQATGKCKPTSETPGVDLPVEEKTSREITYQLDTGFSSLNIVNTSCKFEPYLIKDGYRYYKVAFRSHPYGNQEYDKEFAFDFLGTGGEVVGPLENVNSGTAMTNAEAAAYYKGHSTGRLQTNDIYHDSPEEILQLDFYVRYPDSDEEKEDKLKITTTVIGSDNDGYDHQDPDNNDIVSGSYSYSHTWVKYPDKPIGDYYKSPIGQERDRLEIFSPVTVDKSVGGAYFVMGVGNDSVVGREGDNNTLVITDTGIIPDNDAPEFDYEFSYVEIPLIRATPKLFREDIMSIVPYDREDSWFDTVKVEGSKNGTSWETVYEGDGSDYQAPLTSDRWYGKGYKNFRITFSGIKEGVALTGEFARVSLKSNEYTQEFLSRQDLDQYTNWMHVDVYESDNNKAFDTDDWAKLTLIPFKENGQTRIEKNTGRVTNDTDTATAYVEFNVQTNMVLGSDNYYARYSRDFLKGLGKELKKLKAAAPDFFSGMYSLDEFGNGVMYDLLPPGYHFEELVKTTPPYSTGTGYGINGVTTSQEAIWPEYEVIENYKGTGREMVIFTFPTAEAIENLEDEAVTNVRLELNYKTSIKWEELVYYQNERNFVAVQSENGVKLYNGFPDNGAPERESVNLAPFQDDLVTDDGSLAYYDVNGDGDTTTNDTLYTYVTVSPNVVMSTQSGIEKDIMGDSGEWCKLDHTDINKTYKYRIRVHTSDNGRLTDLIIYDTLEEAANTNEWEGEVPWKGIFQSVDTSWLTRHGYAPVVYYSTSPVADLDYNIITGRENNPWINDSDLWTMELPSDLSKVTAVAVDCRKMADGTDAVLDSAKGVQFEIKMTAPEEYPTLEDPNKIYAYNRPAYSCMTYASFSADPDYFTDIGHRVQIYLDPKVQVKAKKIWDDEDDQDGIRPEKITINLLANGEIIDSKDMVPDEDGNWEVEFDVVPMLDENNEKIEYTITEDPVKGYKTSISEYEVTNTHKPETIDISGAKIWNDADNQDGVRPEEITIHLIADGEEVDSVTVTEEDEWKYSFTDLPKNKKGVEIKYTVEEEPVENYETAAEEYDITNTHIPETTELSGTKTWSDEDDQDGIRPKSITVKLMADGEEVDSITVTEEDEWKYSFTDIPKYKAGVEIEYTVEEVPVEGYEAKVEGDMEEGFIITNIHIPETVEINGSKTWDDKEDQDGIRPESITVKLLADGEEINSVVVTKEDEWKFSFADLSKYKAGAEIEYTIEEEPVKGYETEIEGDVEKGISIINTHKPSEEKEEKVKDDKKKPEKEEEKNEKKTVTTPKKVTSVTSPKTGDDMNLYGYFLLFVAAGIVAAAFYRKMRR